ncbi:MAG: polyprenyl synthetase family protein [DPANN group archaeon]|nr:polyprenyl synthetase family protein [DPANN group archaeon]
MDAVAILKEHKKEVDARLAKFLDEKIAQAKEVMEAQGQETSQDAIQTGKELISILKDYNVKGGKRIRPAFVVEAYKGVGGTDLDAAYDASLGIELLQAFFIIHDDIMDQDNLRRGMPTVHYNYKQIGEDRFKLEDGQHFGESMGILGGDFCESFGNEAILDSKFSDKIKIEALRTYHRTLQKTGFGQLIDITGEIKPDIISQAELLTVHRLKTSGYTIEGPMHLGIVLGDGTEQHKAAATSYALPLGQAFQLRDDILGMFGSEEVIGKPANSDLKEGKKTLLIIKALENANPVQREIIFEALGNPHVTKQNHEEVKQVIRETGSLEYSENMARGLAQQGISAIKNSSFNQDAKDWFVGMADYLINREF